MSQTRLSFPSQRKRALGTKSAGTKRARSVPRDAVAVIRSLNPRMATPVTIKLRNIITLQQTVLGYVGSTFQVWDTSNSSDWSNYAAIYGMYSVEKIKFQFVPKNAPVDGASRASLNSGQLFLTFNPDMTPTALDAILTPGVSNGTIEEYSDVVMFPGGTPFTYSRRMPPRIIGTATKNIHPPGWADTADETSAADMPGAINFNSGSGSNGTLAVQDVGTLMITRIVKFAARR